MQSKAATPDEYIASLPEERKDAMQKLRKTLLENLPNGFSEEMQYGMMSYVVPHSLYPQGYHCDTRLALPFLAVASQKNFVALYHMGIYADEQLLQWFISEYPKHSKKKLDMGKSCIRFKKTEDIPYELIGQLAAKMTPEQWISLYEDKFRRQRGKVRELN